MGCECDKHYYHMCALKERGEHEEVKRLSSQPTVECRHCGSTANSIENICAAHLEENAPNVEGGHGSVNIANAGKAHAGDKIESQTGKEEDINIKEIGNDGFCGGY